MVKEPLSVRDTERIPVDGQGAQGQALVDEAHITGRTEPELRTQGDKVFAGTTIQQGHLPIKATGGRCDLPGAGGAHGRFGCWIKNRYDLKFSNITPLFNPQIEQLRWNIENQRNKGGVGLPEATLQCDTVGWLKLIALIVKGGGKAHQELTEPPR